MKSETHRIKIATLHGYEAEKMFFYEQAGNATLMIAVDKDANGEYVAELTAEFYIRKGR
jgi:putative heme iron utilization protein